MLWPIKIRNQFYHKMMCARDKNQEARANLLNSKRNVTHFFYEIGLSTPQFSYAHNIIVIILHATARIVIYMDSGRYISLSIYKYDQSICFVTRTIATVSTELKSSYLFHFKHNKHSKTCHITVRQTYINCLMMLKDKDEMCLNKINVRALGKIAMMMKFLHPTN